MLRAHSICLTLLALGLGLTQAQADDTKSKHDDMHHATITKMDAKAGSITLSAKGADGKATEKTMAVASSVHYWDGHGKALKMDAFHAGDHVVYAEKDGKITDLKKTHAEATITKVDAKKGTVTVKMTDENGKQVEKTFMLTETSEYVDSTGRVAAIDVFQSGDYVLFVEEDGKIKELRKDDKKTADAKK
jgi:hypothetical protein